MSETNVIRPVGCEGCDEFKICVGLGAIETIGTIATRVAHCETAGDPPTTPAPARAGEYADSDGREENWGEGEDTSLPVTVNTIDDEHEGEDGEAHRVPITAANGDDDRADSDPPLRVVLVGASRCTTDENIRMPGEL